MAALRLFGPKPGHASGWLMDASNVACLFSPPRSYWKRWSRNSIPPLPSPFMREGLSLHESKKQKKRSIRLPSSFTRFRLPAATELSQQGPHVTSLPCSPRWQSPEALTSPQSQPCPRPRPRPSLSPPTRVPRPSSRPTLFRPPSRCDVNATR